MVFIQPNWLVASPPGLQKRAISIIGPRKPTTTPTPTDQTMNFASGLHNMISTACSRQRDHSGRAHVCDECYNLPVIAEGSVTDSAPQQRPVPRQRRSSWKRKAVVAWKDGTGALRRINNRRNSHIPSGFEMVASRFSWIYIQGRR